MLLTRMTSGNGDALIAADRVVAALGRSAAVMRNDELIFVEEHVADGYGFVQQAAGIAAHVEDEAIELRSVKLLRASAISRSVVSLKPERRM